MNVVKHELLPEHAIKTLHQNRISSVLEFISEDVNKISTLTKLSLHDVIVVRCDLLARFSARMRGGNNLQDERNKFKYIPTGINRFDLITGGGIKTGVITEICGLAGSGKTQLCYALLIRTIMQFECTALYIDTKGDFSSVTVQKYLEENGNSQEEMVKLMNLIKVVRVWNMHELVELLQQMKNETIHINKLRIIIIDSLPCLMFQFLGDESKTGITLLNKFVNLARYLCKENDLAIVCVNILTRWVEQTVQEVDDQEVIPQGFPNKGHWIEKKYRCLGRYWQHVPALVLQLEKCLNKGIVVNSSVNILATTVKSTFTECGASCYLNISNVGVTG